MCISSADSSHWKNSRANVRQLLTDYSVVYSLLSNSSQGIRTTELKHLWSPKRLLNIKKWLDNSMKKLWFPLYTLVLSCNKLSQNSWKASNFIPQFAIIQNLQRSLLLFTIHRQPWYWNGTTALVGLGLRPISACVIEWEFLGPLVTRRAFTLLPSYLESKLQGRPFWKTIKRLGRMYYGSMHK